MHVPWVLEDSTWINRACSLLCIEVLLVATVSRQPSLVSPILNLLESGAARKIVISNELGAEQFDPYLERFYYVIEVWIVCDCLADKSFIEVKLIAVSDVFGSLTAVNDCVKSPAKLIVYWIPLQVEFFFGQFWTVSIGCATASFCADPLGVWIIAV